MTTAILPLPEPPDEEISQTRELLASAEHHREVVRAELDSVRHEPVDPDPMVAQYQGVHQDGLAFSLSLWETKVAQLQRRLSWLAFGRRPR